MAVGEGKFVLYSRVDPPLPAGDYVLTASQELTASGVEPDTLRVADLATHFRVRAPRFALPPDQVLSTFPPAMSEGSYGFRLPQVVLRRRTLPWERRVQDGVRGRIPWLALVVIAEGEAELDLNVPVADCVTPGVHLDGSADSELGNCLRIRKSMLDRIFPTQADVPLLAHAREVDIHDTELMMGDDDGFLAVVIANRLPLPGRGDDGAVTPMKYVACLVNLEGQFTSLSPRAPEPTMLTVRPLRTLDPALATPQAAAVPKATATAPAAVTPRPAGMPQLGATAADGIPQAADVYAEMAREFRATAMPGFVAGTVVELDPVRTFPVLLHWSFTSSDGTTFRSLMENLDSALLGTVPAPPEGEATQRRSGREPIEVVETGHLGLVHRTRRGDPVRSWYRGPLVAHPMTDTPRLDLAHAADQVRTVIPDGREDITLAAAFEIGRLLALARPAMIAAILRWRQSGYQAGRRGVVWNEFAPFVRDLLRLSSVDIGQLRDPRIGVHLGRGLADAVVRQPETFLGAPVPIVTPGRPLSVAGNAAQVLARGFGLNVHQLAGEPEAVLSGLRAAEVAGLDPVVRAEDGLTSSGALAAALGEHIDRLSAEAAAVPWEGLQPDLGSAEGPSGGGSL